MGVNVQAYLYRSVSIEDIGAALAIAAGNDPNPSIIGSGPRAFESPWAEVRIEPGRDGCLGMYTISYCSPAGFGTHFKVNLHTIHQHGFGWLLMPPSTGFWIASMRRLVDLFGGAVDYDDSDDSEADYFRFEKPIDEEELFVQRQQDIIRSGPLTAEEVAACVELSAYKR